MSRPTLDTRRVLYGELRLSNVQVLRLRDLANGATTMRHDASFYALLDRMLINGGPLTSSGVCAEITEQGRKILAQIDRANSTQGA